MLCINAKHETQRMINVTQKIQKAVRVQSYFRDVFSFKSCLIVFIVIYVLCLEYLHLR